MAGKTVWLGPKVQSKKRFYALKYILLAYLTLVLVFEIAWTFFIVKQFKSDLQSYDWDEVWIKEFFKSTKNFFIFTVILTVLGVLMGK